MNEELNELETLTEQTELPEQVAEVAAVQEQADTSECDALIEALAEAKLKLALLMNGVAKQKLEEAAQLAAVFIAAGLAPEDAAAKTVLEYPHLRLLTKEMPRFSAQSGGSTDGFSSIRSIFAKR